LLVFAAAALLSASVYAQGLAPSASVPSADGSLGTAEYSHSALYGDMTFASSLSADGKTLYVGLSAPSTGWVAVGLGSLKMDGAFMVLGYDDNGKTEISEETGKGHSHKTNTSKILSAGAVRESGGNTVLEFALPAAGYLKEATLKILVAYGRRDNLTSIHAKFKSFELPLVK